MSGRMLRLRLAGDRRRVRTAPETGKEEAEGLAKKRAACQSTIDIRRPMTDSLDGIRELP